MANPVPINSGPVNISSAENEKAEEMLRFLVQIIGRGTDGTEPTPAAEQADEHDPSKTKPFLMLTKEQQQGMRHLALSLAKVALFQSDSSDRSAAGKIVRANAQGRIDRSFIDQPVGSSGGNGGPSFPISQDKVEGLARALSATEKTANRDQPGGYPSLGADGKLATGTLPRLSDVVHLEGAETITGEKAFTQPVTVGTPTSGKHAVTVDYLTQYAAGTTGGSTGSSGPATQLQESSGPTTLTMGPVSDGQYLLRSGTFVIGSAVSTSNAATTTRWTVTGSVALTGSGNILADVTGLTAAITLTLPAATSGQRITISDKVGTAGTGAYLVGIRPSGSETIRMPEVGSTAGLYMSDDSATFDLVGSTGTGWSVESGKGYALDPRSISGLYCWYDARRGLTLSGSSMVTTWADFSGNGRDASQSVAARRPVLSNFNGRAGLLFTNALGTLVCPSASLSTGVISIFIDFTPRGMASPVFPGLFAFGYTGANSGIDLCYRATQIGGDYAVNDILFFCNGYTAGRNPRCIGYVSNMPSGFTLTHVVATHTIFAQASNSGVSLYLDDVPLTVRTSGTGSIPTLTSQKIVIGGEDDGADVTEGWIHDVIVYSSALSAADSALVRNDISRQIRTR